MNEADKPSVLLTKAKLEHGGARVTISPNDYDQYDVIAETPKGTRFILEVKSRGDGVADTFHDVAIEQGKLLYLQNAVKAGLADKAEVFSYYDNESIVRVVKDISTFGDPFVRDCLKSTCYGNGERMMKNLVKSTTYTEYRVVTQTHWETVSACCAGKPVDIQQH